MRVITEDGDNLGVLSREDALSAARDRELDLILVNPNIEPPLAKIISWSKFKYEQSKKQKVNKSSDTKEMWFKPFMESGDIAYRVKRIQEFLEKGDKVKATVRYKRGADRQKMQDAMDKIIAATTEFAKSEGDIKGQGRDLSVTLVAKK